MMLVRINESPADLHITASIVGHCTLCGWVDVPHRVEDGPKSTCPLCCRLVRYARQIPDSALGAK